MARFTASEIEQIDRLWRALPAGHVWTGWASTGEEPEEIWIFRTRAHWRRFLLTKTQTGYRISNEAGESPQDAETLVSLLQKVEAIPGLGESDQD
jgi:hypothetical protein